MTQLLARIGSRIKSHRLSLGLSVKALAEQSDLSPRFISDVEAGKGNIAIGRLHNICQALGEPIESVVADTKPRGDRQAIDRLLLRRTDEELSRVRALIENTFDASTPKVIALLGIRGSGKSTIGASLSAELGIPFLELNDLIEEAASMSLGEIFEIHGESYYRRLEGRCLSDIVAKGDPLVVAMPGGVVNNEAGFELVRNNLFSVWLRTDAQTLWARVEAQGDTRPMADRENAMADLAALVEVRRTRYELADLVIDTGEFGQNEVLQRVKTGLDIAKVG